METEIYKEKQPLPFRYLLAGVGVGVMLFGAWSTRNANPVSSLIMVGMAVLFVLVFWGFTQFTVVVTPTELRFGFPLFRKRFAFDEIQVGETERITLLAGIGIHYWAGRWVYNARLGEGVNVSHGKYRYLLGSRHPRELQHVLMERVPQSAVRS